MSASPLGLGLPLSGLLPTTAVLFVVYTAVVWIVRIYFSPLSHIPGPRLAAATRWYEFYYDAVKTGRYFREIERMHEQYGPIVRITPYEVHINDPTFFNDLYNVTKKLDKDPWYYSWLNRNGSIFATVDADLHKLRSDPIKKAFSTSSVARVEGVLKTHFAEFSHRLQECKQKSTSVPLSDAWRSLAVDIVTDLSLPESQNLLKLPDWGATHSDFIRGITELSLWNRHFLFLNIILEKLPKWVVGLQGETAVHVVDGIEEHRQQAIKVIQNEGKPISNKTYPIIMNEIFNSPELPAKEKSIERLYHEIGILIGAGSETTGHTLATITYHILSTPDVAQKLKEELASNFSEQEFRDVVSYKQLDRLPYLNACIQEGLRLATSVCGRLPRVNRFQPTTYTTSTSQSYVIPAGTPISMSIRDLHYNTSRFPSPYTFDPARWLGEQKVIAERSFAPFGRGNRSCVGKNLAMAELLMGIGNLIGGFDVRLCEGVGRRDLELEHDCFSPFPMRGTEGVRVLV